MLNRIIAHIIITILKRFLRINIVNFHEKVKIIHS
jgi:hypothetical protein